ncbi:hypothetical protein [Runella salmonicolor]|uniref:Uncharacterized protein n=1 Tax=Runella salmonicolor TaxID=2950278 RepID=A0ABT1FVQ5_9BACT|nr:hypothetical protein [Runella salmonicolor]MCP1384853.1 hypothetical protein [Runella salmonicolor]
MKHNLSQMAANFQKKIIDLSCLQPSECHCEMCQQMCHTAPCIGTPFDMFLIQERPDFRDKVAITMNVAATRLGLPPILMIAPSYKKEKGHCAFFENGKCVLHEIGLKPTEGKLASCKNEPSITKATRLIMESWLPLQMDLAPVFFNNI